MGEGDAPHAGELHAGVGVGAFVALEVLLVQELYGVGLGEVGAVTVPGGADEGGVLDGVTASEASVVFDVGGEGGLLAEVELAGHLGVGSLGEPAAEVYIDEVEPGAPFVGFELLDGHGVSWSACLFLGVEVASEVVVELDVLRMGTDGGDEQYSE